MNKIKYILLFTLFGLGSCNKLLDTQPDGVYTTVTFYNTPAQMQQALNGCYGGFIQAQLYGQVIGFNFDADNDEEQANTTSATLATGRGTAYTWDASLVYVANLWRFFYIQITDCNYLLANINKPKWSSQEAQNEIQGQALFIRAFCYFNLVINYGGVPLLTAPVGINDVNNPRASVANVYAQIVSDLRQAETLLQNFTLKTTNGNGYATETAVQALLAKVYLYMASYPTNDASKYDSCLVYCQKVMNSGIHSLNPNYSQVFKNLAMDIEDPKEDIWEIENYDVGVGVSGPHSSSDIGNFVGTSSTYIASDTTSYAAVGWVNATKTLYDSYGVDPNSTVTYAAQGTGSITGRIAIPNSFDTRRDWNISPYHYTVSGTTRTVVPWPYPWQMYTKKFDRRYVPWASRQNGSYGINFPVIRYADVLLMYAEAYNQVNGGPGASTSVSGTALPTSATDAINLIRRRGWGILYGNVLKSIIITNGGSGYTSTPTVTISGGGGSGAIANAIVVNGVVTGINITQRGMLTTVGPYFTSAPTITISGGGGSGASATATISTATDADLPQLSQSAFLQAIKDERRREMCFEACRRNDLIRWGGYATYIQNYLQAAVTDGCSVTQSGNIYVSTSLANITQRNELFPVPLYDLQLNQALTQNPGW